MAFFDNLGKKVGEAAQAAAKKSGELVEVTKLNMSIGTEEDKIKRAFEKIGERIFVKFNSGEEVYSDFIADCEEIKAYQNTISSLKQKIMEIKNMKACTGCGADLDRNATFCPKCGTKQEQPAAEEQNDEGKFCPKCGATVTEGSAFCQSCGTKI